MGRPRYKGDPAPKIVSRGTVSKRKKLPKWNPRLDAANATPRVVKHPRTIA